MSINYALHENKLTRDPLTGNHTSYAARVQPAGTADMDVVINRIIDQGSTVVKADILGVLEGYHNALESLVLDGMTVVTPAANFRPSVKGVFDSRSDRFDARRHQVRVSLSPGIRLRKAVTERAQVVKQETTQPRPNPLDYVDANSGTRNEALTPGGMGQASP